MLVVSAAAVGVRLRGLGFAPIDERLGLPSPALVVDEGRTVEPANDGRLTRLLQSK